MPITGQPILAARSMILTIFSAITSPSEPPKTVKSWREDAHAAALDRAVAGDHGVAPRPVLLHPELVRAVADERVELLEGAGVEQLLDPLAGGVLALGVLLLDRGLGGVVDGGGAQLLELGEPLLVGLGALLAHGARDPMPRAARRAGTTRAPCRSGAASRSPAAGGGSSRSRTFSTNDSRTALGWRSIQTSWRRSASSRPKTSSAKERRSSRGCVSIQRCSGSRAACEAARATGPGAVRIERSVAEGTGAGLGDHQEDGEQDQGVERRGSRPHLGNSRS